MLLCYFDKRVTMPCLRDNHMVSHPRIYRERLAVPVGNSPPKDVPCIPPKSNGDKEEDASSYKVEHVGLVWPNVEFIRANDGAARAPHETCLRRASDTLIG
jgi:hypothetical protein